MSADRKITAEVLPDENLMRVEFTRERINGSHSDVVLLTPGEAETLRTLLNLNAWTASPADTARSAANRAAAIAEYAKIVVANDAVDAVLEALANDPLSGDGEADWAEIAYEIEETAAHNDHPLVGDDFDRVRDACQDGTVAAVFRAIKDAR